MSVFDKLKAYSRKPAAVILATVMATSTIPTTPIAQAVTAAYAESTTQTTKETEATETKVTPADLGIKKTPWDGKSNITLPFSTHIDNGEAVATISANQVKALVKDRLENSEDFKNQFVYTQNGQDALSKQIDAKLDDINNNVLPKKNVTSEDGTEKTEYSNAVYKDGSMTREITACKVQLTNNTDGANSVAKVNDDGSITIKSDGEISGTVNLKVTQLSVKVGFGYKYTKTVTKTASSSSNSDDSTSNNNRGISIEVGTVDGNTTTTDKVPSNTTVTPTVVDNDADAKADVTLKDVTSGYGAGSTVSTAQIEFKEYYSGLKSESFNDVNAEGLIYKTDHDSFDVFTSECLGLKPEIVSDEANDEYFDVKPTASVLDMTQSVQITPKKAFESEKTFTINWVYPNGEGNAGTTTVHVKGIAKKPLNLSDYKADDQVDFRMATDQDKYLKDAANKAAKKAIEETKTGDEVSDFYKSASIKSDDYSDYYTNATAYRNNTLDKTKLTLDQGDNAVLDNYAITGQPTVVVKPMVSKAWSDNSDLTKRLSLAGTGLKPETFTSPSDTWIKTNATAKWQGGKLADTREGLSADTKFVESTDGTNRGGQGKMENSFYVQDSKDKIVREITGTSYLFDDVKPGLSEFKAVPVGKSFKDDANKKVWAAENMKVRLYTTEGNIKGKDKNGDEKACASGINKIEGSYKEYPSKGGEVTQPVPADAIEKTDDGYGYEFSLSADSKVNAKDIRVTLTDNAGNVGSNLGYENAFLNGAKNTNIDVEELAATTTAPTISTSWNTTAASNGKYYNVNRTLTVTIHAPFFEYTQEYLGNKVFATVTKDGGSYRTLTPGDFKSQGNDTWVATVDFTEDGDYEVSNVNVQDILGRGSTADGDTFTIDKTAPKLNVSWNTEAAQNGKYYNAARTATITVEEHNFDPNLFKIEAPVSAGNGDEATPAQIGGWSSNGDTHTATVTFPGQGVYTLSVSGEDLASNKSESYTSPEFVIDTIKPKIDIQNVVNRTAYAGEVAPTAAVHDTNLADGTSIEVSKISYPLSKDDPNPYAGAAINTSATDKSVSYLNPAKTKGNDGVYTLTVQAIDLAGNTESEAVTWSVNRFGSTYVISDNTGKMLDQYLKSSKTTDVKVTEINPSGLDDNKTSVELTRDTKNTTLKSGDNYTTDANTASGWSEYNYTVSKSNYDKDGAYRVLFHSEDAAGNSSENTMEGKNAKKSGAAAEINFAVDDTAPIASFVDLASNGKYEESSHKAKVSFEDNLKLSKAQIKVNGKTVATFTADQLEKSPIREFTLDGSSSKQDVTVVAWDAAGNKSKELKATGVLVTNDSFVLWMNNLPLMVGAIVAIVVVAGGIYMVVAKKRKENEEK